MARGDHIRVRRIRGLYSHHGIDMGDGTVIHLDGEPLRARAAKVCRVPMDEFLRGGRLRAVAYPHEHLDPEESAAEAERLLGLRGYDLWLYNCEHFAYHCRTGKRRSVQVERAAKAATTAMAASATVLSTVIVSALVRHRLRSRS